jgi:hypothetical protein
VADTKGGVVRDEHEWVWPTSEALHFLGMSLMFGALLVVCVRLLGGMRSMPLRPRTGCCRSACSASGSTS